MAGSPKRRARRLAEQARQNGTTATRPRKRPDAIAHLETYYAEEHDTFTALRTAMVQRGIVDHGINPYDAIQRAIDDTTMDYVLIRNRIDKDSHGDPKNFTSHDLYPIHETIREAMVRYSTFAMQYDIQRRQLKLSEARVALLAVTLREVLTNLGISQEKIKQVPRLLIEQLQREEPQPNGREGSSGPQRLDPLKAEALAEILVNDSEVEILDAE